MEMHREKKCRDQMSVDDQKGTAGDKLSARILNFFDFPDIVALLLQIILGAYI